MKKILFGLLFISPFFGTAQSITADPALEPMRITTVVNSPILVTQLPLNGIIKLKVPILNRNLANGLPDGTCKVKIGLGSKLILNPSFNLSTVNTSDYFNWSAVSSGGQVQITGDLIAQLPANYSDTAYFDVRGSILGNSTITTNFLVTNHNTLVTLSDENGANNIASIAYTIVNGVVPVTFTNIFTEKNDCSLKVIFDIENQINVDRYELELSSDLTNFEKITSLKASNVNRYTYNFNLSEKYQVNVLLVRIKSIDADGTFQYSEIKKVSGLCNSKAGLFLYPNPVPQNNNSLSIQKSNGLFNGSYLISVLDMAGKLIQTKTIQLVNVERFNYDTQNLSAGQYLIKVLKVNDNSIENLKFIKL
jgi:Secretion system C-terminal sorting domain